MSVPEDERLRLTELLTALPGLAKAHILSPATASDRYHDDGAPPMLALQLYYARLEELELAASAHGALQALCGASFASLAGAAGSQQAMWARRFPVPAPTRINRTTSCAYMVHYEGTPADLNAWHAYYIAHHLPTMARFSGIREIEIYTRVDWLDALPWKRLTHFQRNKVVFDHAEALEAALHSPVRDEMKADFARFPHFTGTNAHFPMECRTIVAGQG